MNLTDAIATVQFRLGNRTDLADVIEREIRFAQEREELDPTIDPWFLVQESTLVLEADEQKLALPVNYNREEDDSEILISIDSKKWAKVVKKDYDDALEVFDGNLGMPQYYCTRGVDVYLFPIPDKQYQLRFPYIKHDTVLSTSPEELSNLWLTNSPFVIVAKAGIALAQSLKNKTALKDFVADHTVARTELQNASVHRNDVNRQLSRIEKWD